MDTYWRLRCRNIGARSTAYFTGAGPVDQWPHRIGRHEAAAKFPAMLVRQFLRELGYLVFVSGLADKVSIDSYSLAMFPGKRRDAASQTPCACSV